jgi:hypothetical protein
VAVALIQFGPRPTTSGTFQDVSYWTDWVSPAQGAPPLTGTNIRPYGEQFTLPTGAPAQPPVETLTVLNLLTDADNPLIRALIRTDLGPNDLPDAVIEMAYPYANARVASIDTLAPWPAGSQQANFDHQAAVYLAAAHLIVSVPLPTRERFEGYLYELQPFDPQERADALRATAQGLLMLNMGPQGQTFTGALRAVSFTTAAGGRGDVSNSGLGQLSPYRQTANSY